MNTNEQSRSGHVVIGVDTHKHVHVAAAMDTIGGTLATLTIPTDTGGFQQLLDWATSFGRVLAFGIEGTGSYGATLASFLRRAGHKVIEAGRPDRRLRRMNGKSDTLDAENAARAVLAGFATATPKSADGEAEMIRQLKIAHDQAVGQRSAAMVTIKAMLVHAPDALRHETSNHRVRGQPLHGIHEPPGQNHNLRSLPNPGRFTHKPDRRPY
ncbi:transposase [Streptomyces sp. H10-C2]|uniref:IS110 family transposase n=1 Tax=unclassified Streptomyces TaxID=2593676 RepID=UPI0024B97A49|nr:MULTISPECIES: transposase [unclassified Streptomyces]MDJ0346458.1 transposase [Streptomyces sp. PH10-H1]MDJ0374397.1 transposase [Streptomyces sp. H10-C2]